MYTCYYRRSVISSFDCIKKYGFNSAQQIVPSQECVPLPVGNELSHVEVRERCVIELALYSAYYLADEKLIESQHCAHCNSRETSSLGVVQNDSGSTHRRCFCPLNIQNRSHKVLSAFQIRLNVADTSYRGSLQHTVTSGAFKYPETASDVKHFVSMLL